MQSLVLPLVQPRTSTCPGWTLPVPPVPAALWLAVCAAWWPQRPELPAATHRGQGCLALLQQGLEHMPPALCVRWPNTPCLLWPHSSPPSHGLCCSVLLQQQPACKTNWGVKTFLSGTKTGPCLHMCQGGTCMSTRGGHCLHHGGAAEGCSMGKLNTHRGQTCRAGFVN